jgi:hypothetical protein
MQILNAIATKYEHAEYVLQDENQAESFGNYLKKSDHGIGLKILSFKDKVGKNGKSNAI